MLSPLRVTATTTALAFPGGPSSRTGVWTQKGASVSLHLILFHVLTNPFDLLMPPPIYSALALQLKGVTSSFIVLP